MTKNWLLRDNLLFSLLKVNIVWGCDLKAIHFIINHGGLPAQCAHCGLVGECSRVHTGVLSQNACGWVVCFHKVFFMFMWLRRLTCICFCGCDVWVAAGSTFSRGPRALSPPSELIIYSIYKTLYVQNRKICQRKQETWKDEWHQSAVLKPTDYVQKTQIHNVVTAEPQVLS